MAWNDNGGKKSLKIGLNSPGIANALSGMKSVAQNKSRTDLTVVCMLNCASVTWYVWISFKYNCIV